MTATQGCGNAQMQQFRKDRQRVNRFFTIMTKSRAGTSDRAVSRINRAGHRSG
jgi:hypothetical protein